MGTCGLPDMQAWRPGYTGLSVSMTGRTRAPTLQILYNTFNYIYSVAYIFSLWFSVTLS